MNNKFDQTETYSVIWFMANTPLQHSAGKLPCQQVVLDKLHQFMENMDIDLPHTTSKILFQVSHRPAYEK